MSARVSSHHYAEALLRLSQQDVGDAALSVAVDRVADELVRAGRAAWLDQVLAAFTRLAGADLGRREVHVTSPQPLRDWYNQPMIAPCSKRISKISRTR